MVRVDPQRRTRLIEEFEQSEMTAVAFARRHRLNYTTFCGWLHRHRRADQPAFVEVEVLGQTGGEGLVVELGSQARVRLEEEAQVPLLASLIKACNSTGAC
jgi:hypothetical protein